MTNYIELNEVKFEVCKIANLHELCANHINHHKTLDRCYQKPSAIKRAIYNDWREWFCNTDNTRFFGIRSYNGFMFTLGCVLYEGEQVKALIEITKCHNRIYIQA